MGIDWAGLMVLSLLWAAYGALHSLLASAAFKRVAGCRWPGLMPAYRLAYNLVAVLALLPVLGFLARHPGPWIWRWHRLLAWVMNGAALLAAGLLVSGAGYDLAEFLGFRQLRDGRTAGEDREPFRISRLHRYVRHPWYSLSLVILWTRDMSAGLLISALWITAYFVLGSRLEERKLLGRFGSPYRDYMARVPGLVPRPWKVLSRDDARKLGAA
jgi:protein-S-isoprenylcysteine O-methyltransferase Ste14